MDPISSYDLPVSFPLTNFRAERRIPRAVLDTGRVSIRRDDGPFMLDNIVISLAVKIVTETLPPQQITDTVTDPRWATWWDHLKATYRDRWWCRALVRRWPPRTVQAPITVTVPVAARWTYPHASLRVPPEFGAAVLYAAPETPYQGWPR